MEILFKDYFKAAFTRCVEGYQRQHPNDGKLELSIEAYDETAIDPRVDINITTKDYKGIKLIIQFHYHIKLCSL